MRSVKIVHNHVERKCTTAFEISVSVNYCHETNFEVMVIDHAEETDYCTMSQNKIYQWYSGEIKD